MYDNFGVTIGLKEGRVYVGESNNVIKDWDNRHIAEGNVNIR